MSNEQIKQTYRDVEIVYVEKDGADLAATRMRDKCVDAIRAVARELGRGDNQVAAQQVNGCLRAIDAISSLTLDQVEEK